MDGSVVVDTIIFVVVGRQLRLRIDRLKDGTELCFRVWSGELVVNGQPRGVGVVEG